MASRRERILTTAEHAFLERGFDGTSIDAIVEEAGGSKATVYAHFRDKRVLFAHALADVRRGLGFDLPHFRDQEPASARDGLVLLAVELMTAMYSVRALHLQRLVIAEAHRFPDVARQYFDEGPAVAIAAIAAWIRECRDRGDSGLPDPQIGAERLFALVRGPAEMRVVLGLDPVPEPDQIVTLAEAAVAALLGP